MKAIKFLYVVMAMAFAINVSAQNENYNRFFIGYAPTDFDFVGQELRLQGFDLGWSHGFNVTGEQLPLYIEAGISANLGIGEFLSDCDKMLSFEVPVNVTYRYNIPNTKVRLSPYFGFHFKVNTLAIDDDSDSYFDIKGSRRFQFGMQLGANIEFNHFYMGAGWNKDFMPFMHNAGGRLGEWKTSGMRVNVGIVF